MIEDGTKVETDTSRVVDSAAFNDVWGADDAPAQAGDAPADVEAPAPTPEPVAEPVVAEAEPAEAPQSALPNGYTLDKLGRVHRPDGTVASKEEAERVKASVAPAETPAPEAVAPVPPPVTPEPAPVTPPEAFTFRANGQKISIPGLVVPPEHQERVRNLLINGVNHEQNFGRMQSEWKQKLATAEQAAEAKSGKYNKASVYLFDKIAQLLEDNPTELELTKRELALMLKEADLTMPKGPVAEQAPQVDEAQMEQAARATLTAEINELLEDLPDAGKVLSAEDQKDLHETMQSLLNAYFTEHEGEIVLDRHAVKRHVERELKIHQRAHQAREDAKREALQTKAAASFNAAVNTSPAKPPVAIRPKPALAAAPSGAKAPTPDQLFRDAWNSPDDE